MNLQGCIFDLDGVIVDTAKYHYLAWRQIANELGFEFSLHDNERLKGISRMQSLNILLEIGNIKVDEKIREKLAYDKNQIYLSYIRTLTPEDILPGTKEFLNQLKQNNILIALGSASKNASTILQSLDIIKYFDVIIDGNKVEKAKPDPEIFLKGAIELKVSPENCVVFEDAEAGVEAAISAGMKCIGIGDANVLSKAHYVVHGLDVMSVKWLKQVF